MGTENALHGKTALVTGASAGIGRETAHELAAEGANVVLAARREDRLQTIATALEAEHGVEALAAPTDVSDETAVEATVEASVDTFGTLDIVVNNAGTSTERGVDIEEMDTEQYRTVMDVNIDGMFFTTRAALPHLRESSGELIFVSSFAGKHPWPSSPVYGASKWWTRGFALSVSGHVGDDDVGVTVVNPSEVRTEIGKDFRPEDELAKERFEPGEVTEPEEIAEAIGFAARQEPPNMVSELDLFRRDKFVDF